MLHYKKGFFIKAYKHGSLIIEVEEISARRRCFEGCFVRVDFLYFWQAITTVIGALRVFALIALFTDVAVVAQIQSSILYKQFIFRPQEGKN